MKKTLTLLLVLVMVLALAACGETKEAEVVENVDPHDNTMVIETPPAIVSGPDTPVETYPAVNVLPTTAPVGTDPNAGTIPVPTTPPEETQGDENNGEPVADPTPTPVPEITYADDTGKDFEVTMTEAEKKAGHWGYINAQWVNFRVGPGTEYKIYESLPKGAPVLVLGYSDNGWAKILYDDYMIGYVARNYVTNK